MIEIPKKLKKAPVPVVMEAQHGSVENTEYDQRAWRTWGLASQMTTTGLCMAGGREQNTSLW